MQSIQYLFKIGNGPSSSHTMGVKAAAVEFIRRYGSKINKVEVTLYGSLALTGKGHLTDEILEDTFEESDIKCMVNYDEFTRCDHPNTLEIFGFKGKKLIARMRFQSIGGGDIRVVGEREFKPKNIYPHTKLSAIISYCKSKNLSLSEYVDSVENDEFTVYIAIVHKIMSECIESGLEAQGFLPGNLKIRRKAHKIYNLNRTDETEEKKERRIVVACAYAVAEENACGGTVVTAPTCGSSGVLPACVRYAEIKGYKREKILSALKTAGLIGNLVKYNASISGAEAGCQAEIGTACAMAAAFLEQLMTGDLNRIANAAEIALEHHLGLTCDPVDGYVQIPCIERNAVAALRAIDAAELASYISPDEAKISFDMIVDTMISTGRDISSLYRETSRGGLAKFYEAYQDEPDEPEPKTKPKKEGLEPFSDDEDMPF